MSSLLIQQSAVHSAEWFRTVDPVIPADLTTVESDTGMVKVGNGSSHYSTLPYTGTVINDRTIVNQVFYDGPCPDLSFMLNVDETVEFEYSYAIPNVAAGTLPSSAKIGNNVGIVGQVGPDLAVLANSWKYNGHQFFGSASHGVGTSDVGLLNISTTSNIVSASGTIHRRRAIGAERALMVRMLMADTSYIRDSLFFLNTAFVNSLLSSNDPVKFHVSFHPDIRGYFKVLKR